MDGEVRDHLTGWSVGKIVRRSHAGETGDYLVEFHDDPKLYAYRRDDLYPAKAPQRPEAAPVDAHPPGQVRGSESGKLPVGWHPDPATGGQRYWNGEEWAGQASGTDLIRGPSAFKTVGWILIVTIVLSFAAHACATAQHSHSRHNSHGHHVGLVTVTTPPAAGTVHAAHLSVTLT
ncbi:MAG: hypothetical protein JWL96_4661 [Sphingomonas bacterium]|uniref:DUF2510 domain-containing protein n=1 Tax=Sphingomonas bacterium TaxID=1895847 RepID=UPI002621083D|nr:DUF2510 domain-containing protein [Sphingomonas bacterium]MDB5712591.1 hypothetical protein [Sphingomonas bacterium]